MSDQSIVPRDATLVEDCWNKIGVRGDHSCVKLEEHVHCRNCPVYSAAGAELLDQNLPEQYRAERTEQFAAKQSDSTVGKLSVVIFQVGREQFALSTALIQEFARQRPIHSLPHRKDRIVLGLINIGGELLIYVSLARLLGLQETCEVKTRKDDLIVTPQFSIPASPCVERVLVLNSRGNRFVFPVDEVHGVFRFHIDELKAAPATVAKTGSTLVRGVLNWHAKTVGCLDEDLLLSALNRHLT
jgi:chemotaxis-related protein WspD